MNIAFFGSPQFVIPILQRIHNTYGVFLVVTQEDKPVGRKKLITPTPVKNYTTLHKIPVQTPQTLKGFTIDNIDLAIVAAYGLIIPQQVLEQPKYGFINVHYSLLPKYRGASPVQSAILNSETETGTTIMQMDKDLDHGEIISQETIAISQNDTTDSLLIKLTDTSIPLLEKLVNNLKQNKRLNKKVQNHDEATYTDRITKQDAFIEFENIKAALKGNNAQEIHNKIRAYYPWPNAWTLLPNGKRCKLISSAIEEGKLSPTEIQIAGKTKTSDSKLINILLQ